MKLKAERVIGIYCAWSDLFVWLFVCCLRLVIPGRLVWDRGLWLEATSEKGEWGLGVVLGHGGIRTRCAPEVQTIKRLRERSAVVAYEVSIFRSIIYGAIFLISSYFYGGFLAAVIICLILWGPLGSPVWAVTSQVLRHIESEDSKVVGGVFETILEYEKSRIGLS